ncbi:MAG TPA: C40 family peptidase [Pyrinomonadaceae bacterium]|nr:C40 family peptidase [Pyrinomonadaceae bacterium]
MIFNKIVSRVLAASFALSIFAITVAAQNETRLNQVTNITTTTTVEPNGITRLETEPIVISSAAHVPAINAPVTLMRFDKLLLSAIDVRLGARYVWGAAGPHVFDCSGFVWSAFKEVGVDFTRGSARTYWSRFAPAREDEKFKFGTLVFFNGLSHVGIVADANGFYHASRHKGVVYQAWTKYYLSRVDGFRRVSLPAPLTAMAE